MDLLPSRGAKFLYSKRNRCPWENTPSLPLTRCDQSLCNADVTFANDRRSGSMWNTSDVFSYYLIAESEPMWWILKKLSCRVNRFHGAGNGCITDDCSKWRFVIKRGCSGSIVQNEVLWRLHFSVMAFIAFSLLPVGVEEERYGWETTHYSYYVNALFGNVCLLLVILDSN